MKKWSISLLLILFMGCSVPHVIIIQVSASYTYGRIQKYEFKANRKYSILFDKNQGEIVDITNEF